MNQPIDPELSSRSQTETIPSDAAFGMPSWRSVVAVSCWSGLLTGYLELGSYLLRVSYAQHGMLRKNPHVLWEISVSNLGLFLVFGIIVELCARRFTRRDGLILAIALSSLGFLGLLLTLPGLKALSCVMLAIGIGSWIGPAIAARSTWFDQVVKWTLPVLLGGSLVLLGAVFEFEQSRRTPLDPSRPAPAPGSPNVLLIVLDTVRFDATSLDGTGRDTTPFLKSLKDRGVSFTEATTTASWTLPSHASMFTGRWPWELGVGPERPLDGRYPTLAEWMSFRGYRTAGIVGNTFLCSEEYGLSRGFQHYEDYVVTPLEVLRASSIGWLGVSKWDSLRGRLASIFGSEVRISRTKDTHRKTAPEINQAATRWIGQSQDRPFFLFLNYFDVHDPYLPPEDATWKFGTPPASLVDWQTLRDWDPHLSRPRSAHDVQLARNAYDNCLAYLDGRLKRLFTRLEQSGQLDNTIVVVTSDHGEMFGEARWDGDPVYGHGKWVFRPVVHVPLVILAPGRLPTGVQVQAAVSLRDLPATLLDLAAQSESSPFPGVSLARLARGEVKPGPGTRSVPFSEFDPYTDLSDSLRIDAKAKTWMQAVATEGYVYERWGDGRESLHDLRASPSKATELPLDENVKGLLGRMRARLRSVAPETLLPGFRKRVRRPRRSRASTSGSGKR